MIVEQGAILTELWGGVVTLEGNLSFHGGEGIQELDGGGVIKAGGIENEIFRGDEKRHQRG